MSAMALVDVSLHGSYLCGNYELRVTERCLIEDLGAFTPEPFDDLGGQEIIKAFINRRRSGPEDTRQVAPLSSGKPVFRLAYGERHRGATWFDEANRVVWLLGYATHEFEGGGDAFPYFKSLAQRASFFPPRLTTVRSSSTEIGASPRKSEPMQRASLTLPGKRRAKSRRR